MREQNQLPGFLDIGPSTLWLLSLSIGIAGFIFRYPSITPPPKPIPPVQATLLNVRIAEQPRPAAEQQTNPPPTPDESPPLPQPADAPPPPTAPAAPAMTALATPLPIPVQKAPIFPAKTAAVAPAKVPQVAATTAKPMNTPSTPGTLTYGEGQGDQPAPEYPREAALAHQEGTVVVRLTVGEGGRILKAEAADPCPYPLLNQAAVRAVREQWSRPPAPRIAPGTWDVSIEFQLRQR